ncbi:MAG TPA: hypothetical protein V6C85_16895 [Allocoleopsis sp.]
MENFLTGVNRFGHCLTFQISGCQRLKLSTGVSRQSATFGLLASALGRSPHDTFPIP